MRLRGLPGELATQNAVRNTRRTASTAAALMIGLTLVVSMSVFASSLKDSFSDVIGDKTSADLFVIAGERPGLGLQPVGRGQRSPTCPASRTVSASGWGQARFEGQDSSYSAVDPATAGDLMSLDLSAGLARRTSAPTRSSCRPGCREGERLGARRHRGRGLRRHGQSTRSRSWASTTSKGWVADDYLLSLEAQSAFAGPQLVSSALVERDVRCRRGEPSRRPSRPPWPTTRTRR